MNNYPIHIHIQDDEDSTKSSAPAANERIPNKEELDRAAIAELLEKLNTPEFLKNVRIQNTEDFEDPTSDIDDDIDELDDDLPGSPDDIPNMETRQDLSDADDDFDELDELDELDEDYDGSEESEYSEYDDQTVTDLCPRLSNFVELNDHHMVDLVIIVFGILEPHELILCVGDGVLIRDSMIFRPVAIIVILNTEILDDIAHDRGRRKILGYSEYED